MTLSTEYVFLTNDQKGFRECREMRTTSSAATMTVLFCTKGSIRVYYRGEMITIHTGDLFVRIPDFTHELGPYEMSPDFEFKQVTIEADIFTQIMLDHIRIEPNWYAKQEYIKLNPIFPIERRSIDFFNTYFHLLTLQLEEPQTPYRRSILKLIANGAMMEMLNYLDKLAVIEMGGEDRISINQSDYTFHEFTKLLQEYPHKRSVQWYAEQLKITPKYLSELCKERSNKTAGEWIADVTVAEIKHYLLDTTIPIAKVAEIMGFPNASFFCQYVKKHTGMSPNKYRKHIDKKPTKQTEDAESSLD